MKDELLFGGRFRLSQEPGVFPLSMDTMALGAFASVRPGAAVWDLGCGSGALGLLLLGREPTLHYTGLEQSAAACALAEKNLAQNGLEGRILHARIEEIPRLVPGGCADLVISNPPYFPRGKAGTAERTGCTLEALCAGAGRLLKPGGRFALTYPAGELASLCCVLQANGLEPKRLRFAAHKPSAAPKLVLAEAVKGGRPGLELLPGLFWYTEEGEPSPDYRRIYHEE